MGARRINVTRRRLPCSGCAIWCMHVTDFGMSISKLCKSCPRREKLILPIRPRPRRITVRRPSAQRRLLQDDSGKEYTQRG
jgi:hypothetical protein